MRMLPLLADFIYNRVCELKCKKFLTLPRTDRISSLLKPNIFCDARGSFRKTAPGIIYTEVCMLFPLTLPLDSSSYQITERAAGISPRRRPSVFILE